MDIVQKRGSQEDVKGGKAFPVKSAPEGGNTEYLIISRAQSLKTGMTKYFHKCLGLCSRSLGTQP